MKRENKNGLQLTDYRCQMAVDKLKSRAETKLKFLAGVLINGNTGKQTDYSFEKLPVRCFKTHALNMRSRWFITTCITLLMNCYFAYSQTDQSVDKWMDYLMQLEENGENSERIESLYADFSRLSDHPLPVNLASKEQLKQLPFLSDLQIEALLSYRDRYGKLVSVYELKQIDHFDFETIQLLLPFIRIGEEVVDKPPVTVNNLLKRSSNELILNYATCFQQKAGYRSYPDSVLSRYPNKRYLGEPFYQSVRYAYTFDERIRFGLVAEKDAGEPFWNKHHKGYDYYSLHLELKAVNKWLKTVVLGDYKASFGQGLVLSHDYTPGRTSLITQTERRTNGFRRHYSTNETDYFTGAAFTAGWHAITFNGFYSYRKLDGTVDSSSVLSFKTDGLHRLVREREKRRQIPMHTFGGNLHGVFGGFSLGATVVHYSFSGLEVQPDAKPYNLHYFRGHQHTNLSVDYKYGNRHFSLYGETAFSANGAAATLNALQLTPVSYLTLLMMYRYYDKRYQAFFGNAFGQQSAVQNEQGLYMGLRFMPFAGWQISAYADYYKFPWMKYGVDQPSHGLEWLVQIDYQPVSGLSSYIRYKNRNRQVYQQQQIRYQLLWKPLPAVYLKASADYIRYKKEPQQHDGWMVAMYGGWNPVRLPLQTDLSLAWFTTDDYQSRIYSYEKNLLYQYYRPMLYGKGVRATWVMRWKPVYRLTLSGKLAWTHYPEQETIGSDLEQIDGNHKIDLYLGLQWKF